MTKRKRYKRFHAPPEPRRLGPPQTYGWLQRKTVELPTLEGFLQQRRHEEPTWPPGVIAEPTWPPGVIAWLRDQRQKDVFDRLAASQKKLAALCAENIEPWWRWTSYVAFAIVVRDIYELRDRL